MYKKIQPMKHNKTGNFSLKTNVALVYLEEFYVGTFKVVTTGLQKNNGPPPS